MPRECKTATLKLNASIAVYAENYCAAWSPRQLWAFVFQIEPLAFGQTNGIFQATAPAGAQSRLIIPTWTSINKSSNVLVIGRLKFMVNILSETGKGKIRPLQMTGQFAISGYHAK